MVDIVLLWFLGFVALRLMVSCIVISILDSFFKNKGFTLVSILHNERRDHFDVLSCWGVPPPPPFLSFNLVSDVRSSF